eukprot:3834028-Alexandrium_andersonii.AAC.1
MPCKARARKRKRSHLCNCALAQRPTIAYATMVINTTMLRPIGIDRANSVHLATPERLIAASGFKHTPPHNNCSIDIPGGA